MNESLPGNESMLPPPWPARRRNWKVIIPVAVMLLAGVSFSVYQYREYAAAQREQEQREAWMKKQKGLPPSGGKFFASRVIIPVPVFAQSDPRWGDDPLGPSTTDTLSSAGCAVSSCAMVLAGYGVDTDPQRLNDWLKQNQGFTENAWLEWSVAAGLSPDKVKFVYENDPSFHEIDSNLEKGNPVIIRLRYTSGITHFVVVCGKDGYDYLIADPGRRAKDGVYPLKEFGSNIEALRYYEPVKS